MQVAEPSKTALRVALRRAAHQLFDRPLVFEDPYAVRILEWRYSEELRRTPAAFDPDPRKRIFSRAMRAYLVMRSRYAEDVLAEGVAGSGVSQYLLLGAGLDTFALRNTNPALRVFEVDHPATQAWKAELLAEADVPWPGDAALVPVDFESGASLEAALLDAGFRMDAVTAVSWLGVVPYLTRNAFRNTLVTLAKLAAGSTLVFDYGLPREALAPMERLMHDSLAARVAQAGEPFRLFFRPQEVAAELRGFGFVVREDLDSEALTARYLAGRTDGLALRGRAGHLLCAVRS